MPDERVCYWLEMCEYDLETAKAMLDTKRYLYVGFMCHQVIEKALKAYLCSLSADEPPYIHSLKRLLTLTGLEVNDKQLELLAFVDPLNLQARYSAYKSDMAKRLTAETCQALVTDTEVFFSWIRTKL